MSNVTTMREQIEVLAIFEKEEARPNLIPITFAEDQIGFVAGISIPPYLFFAGSPALYSLPVAGLTPNWFTLLRMASIALSRFTRW